MALLTSVILPCLKQGFKGQDSILRKGFINLLVHMVTTFSDHFSPGAAMPYLHGDLVVLVNLEDPEADIFRNLTHIQMHRRMRAWQRLRNLMLPHSRSADGAEVSLSVNNEDGNAASPFVCPIQSASMSHFLMPLAMHTLFESRTVAEKGCSDAAVAALAAMAGHLPWTRYAQLLRGLMKQVRNGHGVCVACCAGFCRLFCGAFLMLSYVTAKWISLSHPCAV
jgi:U3 small nucleolar RNA-associated protein 20